MSIFPAILIACCVLLSAAACRPSAVTSAATADTSTPASQKVLDPKAFGYNYHRLEGMYSGDFGGSNIRIILRHITPTLATGYNLHSGLRRNISGHVSMTDKGIQFSLAEPGDDTYDGTFSFTIDTTTATLSGSWQPKNSGSTSAKSYTLSRVYRDTLSEEAGFGNNWREGESDNLLSLDDDGLCTYKYYPAAGQLEEIRGNWVKTPTGYTLYWQKNTIFPEKMVMRQTSLQAESTLTGAGHQFRIVFAG